MSLPGREIVIGVDAGKSVLKVGAFTSDFLLLEHERLAVQSPEKVLRSLRGCLEDFSRRFSVRAAGLSVFGPLVTNPEVSEYGSIVGSSEAAWSGVNLPHLLNSIIGKPVFFDFDVTAGALAERRLGKATSGDFAYLSVGTGIGGVYSRDILVPGTASQMGHIMIPRERGDLFAGSCRFHGDCLQGLASGRALAQRYGVPACDLPEGHPGWDLEARYLARSCVNLLYTAPSNCILMGSSIACAPGLVEQVTHYTQKYLNGFPQTSLGMDSKVPLISKGYLAPNSSLYGAAILGAEGCGLMFSRTFTI